MTEQTFIGPYRVVETIGRGGFATVYRCVDDRLEAEVAIKVLADNHAADPDVRSRFLAEGRILRKIDNRHLVQVHDVGETDRDQPYLVLELASRGDLRSRVTKLQEDGWSPTWDDIRLLTDALLDAAGALHQTDLVHRDLSPANVLIKSTSQRPPDADITVIDPDERLIVADLGFAKDLALSSGLTVGGGTPHFSAPEQFSHGQVTHKSDLYAIAKVLEWFVRSIDADNPQRTNLLTALAPSLSANPDDRPDTAAEMNATITAALNNNHHQAMSPTLLTRPTPPPTDAVPTSVPPFPLPATPTPTAPPPNPQPQPSMTHPPLPPGVESRSRPKLPWFFAGLAVVLTIAIVSIGLLSSGILGSDEVTSIGTNLGRVVDDTDQPQVILDGPIEIPVDRTGVFVAQTPPSSTLVWTLPGGEKVENVNAIEITGNGAGSAVVELEVRTSDDQTISVEFPFDVVTAN